MDQMPRRDRYAEEVDRIREIVARHPLPDFVTGFEVRLGEFDGDPAMWIVFRTNGDDELAVSELERRSDVLAELRTTVQSDLLENFDSRFPYFRHEYAEIHETLED